MSGYGHFAAMSKQHYTWLLALSLAVWHRTTGETDAGEPWPTLGHITAALGRFQNAPDQSANDPLAGSVGVLWVFICLWNFSKYRDVLPKNRANPSGNFQIANPYVFTLHTPQTLVQQAFQDSECPISITPLFTKYPAPS